MWGFLSRVWRVKYCKLPEESSSLFSNTQICAVSLFRSLSFHLNGLICPRFPKDVKSNKRTGSHTECGYCAVAWAGAAAGQKKRVPPRQLFLEPWLELRRPVTFIIREHLAKRLTSLSSTSALFGRRIYFSEPAMNISGLSDRSSEEWKERGVEEEEEDGEWEGWRSGVVYG